MLEFRALFRILPWGVWTVKVTAGAVIVGAVLLLQGSDLNPVWDVVWVSTSLFLAMLVLVGRRPTSQTPFDIVSVDSFAVSLYWVVIFFTTPPSLEFAGGTGAITIQGVPVSWVVTSLVGMNATGLFRMLRRTLGWPEPAEEPRGRPFPGLVGSWSRSAMLAGAVLWMVALVGLVPIPSPESCTAGLCVQVTSYPLYGLTFAGTYIGIGAMALAAILHVVETQPLQVRSARARRVRRPAQKVGRPSISGTRQRGP